MSVPRLYCANLKQGVVTLPDEEARHAVAALRLRVGDEVQLLDGCGGQASGRIHEIGSNCTTVSVGHLQRDDRYDVARKLTLLVAMPKSHRQGFLVEKCTELGVAAIRILRTQRTVALPGDGAVQRLRRRAIEAVKQCGRRWIPSITKACELAESFEVTTTVGTRLVADRDAPDTLGDVLERVPHDDELAVWIGPEGGWSEAERDLFRQAAIEPVSLGTLALRTETAAMTVCALTLAPRPGNATES